MATVERAVTSAVEPAPVCPECDADATWHDEFELVCEDCGLVVDEDDVDHGPEWRSYGDDPFDGERTGAPESFLVHDKGLSTTIDWRDTDAYGRQISADERRKMARLRRWQTRVTGDANNGQNLRVATNELSRMASALDIPRTVAETAGMLYRQALDANLLIGRSIEGVATASLYVACRIEGVPRSLDDFASVARTDRTRIARMYRLLVRELDLPVAPIDPREYVARYCSALDLAADVEARATDIIDAAVEADLLAGKSPTGFAAAAVYLASQRCGDPRSQAAVGEVADVSTVTIRKHYQEQQQVVQG